MSPRPVDFDAMEAAGRQALKTVEEIELSVSTQLANCVQRAGESVDRAEALLRVVRGGDTTASTHFGIGKSLGPFPVAGAAGTAKPTMRSSAMQLDDRLAYLNSLLAELEHLL